MQKLWFFLDNNLVLPEYLIEFDYIQKNILQNKIADFGDTIGEIGWTAPLPLPISLSLLLPSISFHRCNFFVNRVLFFRIQSLSGRFPWILERIRYTQNTARLIFDAFILFSFTHFHFAFQA